MAIEIAALRIAYECMYEGLKVAYEKHVVYEEYGCRVDMNAIVSDVASRYGIKALRFMVCYQIKEHSDGRVSRKTIEKAAEYVAAVASPEAENVAAWMYLERVFHRSMWDRLFAAVMNYETPAETPAEAPAEAPASRLRIEKYFHHISGNGNDVYAYDVKNGPFTVCTVFSLNVAKNFIKAIQAIASGDMVTLIRLIHIVQHKDTDSSNSKLAGIDSVSTSCLKNEICIQRMKNPDSICAHCYAATQQARQHGLDDNNALNYFILNSVLFPENVAALLPWYTQYGRVESFGDVASVIQARNYIRFIKTHPHVFVGIWSKNIGIWAAAFDAEGKPENCTFVQSALRVNERERKASEYVDHVFTVWESEAAAEAEGVTITCGGRKCMGCLRCYKKDTPLYVDQLKK